ncbi:MAG TPA: serine/threonine-protein kinase [Blastocatellia bacterium]|nr:serine/threonine-protein kinase [Blastocatellia bacterium]
MTDLIKRIDNTRRPVEGAAAAAQSNGEQIFHALSTRFDVLKPLGADERAWYYLARERGSGGTAHIKVLAPHVARDARQRELFYLESYAASKLAHFNIARTGEPQELHGFCFCAVEQKQDAWTLRELLDRNGWLDIERAIEIADQIASALDHAHWLGVLHLRLQPESILVEPNGWVTVKDFGIESGAKSDWAYRERAVMLRAPYASVEHARRARMDHRSDLYSLGAILYEMLTDRVPYDSDDDDSVRQKQLSYPPAPPYLLSMDVPEAVSNVVMKLLANDPKNRFDSAVDFQTALDDALNQGGS